MQRRDVLSAIGVGALSTSLPATAVARRRRFHESSQQDNIKKVTHSNSFKAIERILKRQGRDVKTKGIKIVNKQLGDSNKRQGTLYRAPITSNSNRQSRYGRRISRRKTVGSVKAGVEGGSLVGVEAQVGDEYYFATPETVASLPHGVIGFAVSQNTESVGTEKRIEVPETFNSRPATSHTVTAQSHVEDLLPGYIYEYKGTYDVEGVCNIFAPTGGLVGSVTLLENIAITDLSKLSRVFVKISVGGAVGCLTEDVASAASQFIHDCPKDQYEYEVYAPKWWVSVSPAPLGGVAVAKCP